MVIVTVRQKLRRQMSEVLRHVHKMRDPDRQHHSANLHFFAIVQSQQKGSVRRSLNAHNDLVLKLRNHSIAEGEPVIAERRKSYGFPHMRILDAALRTKILQSELGLRIVDV